MERAQANILMVDDRPQNLLALEAILEPLEQNLVRAESGEEALKALLHRDFAVILLDVQMPGLDGFETAALIKRRERTKHVPIIFLTAISKDRQHVFRGYSAGAVDYLFKPFEPDVLRSKVAVFIDLHQKTEQLKEQAEQLHERDLEALERASEERYRTLAEAMPQIVWMAGPTGEIQYYNNRWFEYSGVPRSDDALSEWLAVVHPDDAAEVVERWTHAVEHQGEWTMEYRLKRASDGAYRWHLGRSTPLRGDDGELQGWIGTATDIDTHKRIEEAQRFLLEAGAVLSSSLDYRNTLASVADLAVPHMADWCVVDIVEDDGVLHNLSVAHADPKKIEFLRELQRRYPPDRDAAQGPVKVVRTGEAELVSEISDELLASAARDELHLGMIRELGLHSYMCVPLVSRGRVLGAITMVAAESGRRYEEGDFRLAKELARHAATAVDNAQLYRQAEERARAARVLHSVADGVFMLDEKGTIRLWNPAAAAITGLAEDEVRGRRAADVIPGWAELEPHLPVASAPGTATARPETVPLEIGGRELWLSVSGVGFDEGTVYAFRDLTEERALDAMKSDFVATVSHELRTPLAAIHGSALTILRPDLELDSDMHDRLLRVISEESDRLAEIVNDLLLASHLDSGRLDAKIERTDARGLVTAVVETARVNLPEGLSIELKMPKRIPLVAADPGQLRQVLVNLVDNAVKYSPQGGAVKVTVGRNGEKLRFAIADEGLGIPQGEHGRVFEKFYRLDPNMTRGIGGTGLGLYISRELVRRVGGRIWVESTEGKGSTFFVELPLAADPEGRANGGPRKKKAAPAAKTP